MEQILKLKQHKKNLLSQVEKLMSKIRLADIELDKYNQYDLDKGDIHFHIILAQLCLLWRIHPDTLFTADRHAFIMQKRHIARWVFRNKVHMTYKRIGKMTNADHATVIHSCQFVNHQLSLDLKYQYLPFMESWDAVKKYVEQIPVKFPELDKSERYKLVKI